MKPKCSIKDQRLIPNWFILWLFRRTEKLKYTLNHATILDHFADRKEVGLIAFQKKKKMFVAILILKVQVTFVCVIWIYMLNYLAILFNWKKTRTGYAGVLFIPHPLDRN